jgi:hypothetical protein
MAHSSLIECDRDRAAPSQAAAAHFKLPATLGLELEFTFISKLAFECRHFPPGAATRLRCLTPAAAGPARRRACGYTTRRGRRNLKLKARQRRNH